MGAIEYKGVKIELLGHACFRVEGGGVVIYLDPYQVAEERRDGDIIVCSHDHFDHCSPEDIRKVAKPDAAIVAAKNCAAKVKGLATHLVLLSPGEEAEVKGVKIEAVPAYNVNKPYHPRGYGGIGVVITVAGVRIYHAGDTDFIPEMKELKDIDVALLPVSGTYVMTAEEAAEAAKAIKPKLAIPMHYGAIVGSRRDAEKFAELLKGVCEVKILL